MIRAVLTIDDVPSGNTPAIVDYLNEKGICAILFATGKNVGLHYEEAKYAVKNGMIVGNHSYSHPSFSSLSLQSCIDEIEKCELFLDRLYDDCGIKRSFRPFRFPYGDKGGKNKTALQQYLFQKRFDKADDTQVPYSWWHQSGLHADIDTFWTFDFEEYRMQHDSGFTYESILAKMHAEHPANGAALFGRNNHHILLLHAHDETEIILPEYYRLFIDHLIENHVRFEAPRFL